MAATMRATSTEPASGGSALERSRRRAKSRVSAWGASTRSATIAPSARTRARCSSSHANALVRAGWYTERAMPSSSARFGALRS